jgi:cysteinyl-tRNA synthetase
MVNLIQRLRSGGHAYEVDGSYYFRISTFPAYGRLSRIDVGGLRPGARVDVDEYGKDDPRDFVLWKGRKPGEHFWDTALGPGRPGWHIECSAMSMRYLGESFDLHAGGVDLIFPHHEDEIAQSEAATGKQFVRVWMHDEHLRDAVGDKMSKRTGNFTTLRDLVQEGHQPRAIRYALLSGAHYRSPLNFSPDLLQAAEQAIKRLEEFAIRISVPAATGSPPQEILESWEAALADDLNLPAALGRLFEWIKAFNVRLDEGQVSEKERADAMAMLRHADGVLEVVRFPQLETDADIQRMIDERNAARAARDFARADAIRQDLLKRGVQLDDTREGTIWKRAG